MISSRFKNCATLLIRTDRVEEIWIIFICHNGTIAAAVVASHARSQTKKGLGPKKWSSESKYFLALRLSQDIAYSVDMEEKGWRDLSRENCTCVQNALLVRDPCSTSHKSVKPCRPRHSGCLLDTIPEGGKEAGHSCPSFYAATNFGKHSLHFYGGT